MRLWNIRAGTDVPMPENMPQGSSNLMFSPDGTLLAYGGGNESNLVIYNLATGELRTLGGHHTKPGGSFSPDGRLIVSNGDDNTVRVWDVESGSQLWLLEDVVVGRSGFSPDGTRIIISLENDGIIRLWGVPETP